MADRLELDGTYHNLAHLLRSRRQVHAHRQHQRARREGQGQARRRTRRSRPTCVATTFVLLDKPSAAPSAGAKPAAPAPAKGDLACAPTGFAVVVLLPHASRRLAAAAAGRSPARHAGARAAPLRPRRAAKPEQPPAPENYTYDPAGRRDPFVNLLGAGTEPRPASRKGEGPAGMTVAEISVRGVMQSRGGLIAMVQGPDNKTYIVHPGRQVRRRHRSNRLRRRVS